MSLHTRINIIEYPLSPSLCVWICGWVQLSADKRWTLAFAVFDENRSWYINENIENYSQDPSKIDPNDPDFYSSNVIYSEFTISPLCRMKSLLYFEGEKIVLKVKESCERN